MQTTIVKAEPSRPDHDALARWRRSITWGNRAFDERDYPSAIAHYDAAVSTAESMYGRLDDAEAGTAAWEVAPPRSSRRRPRTSTPAAWK